VGELFQIILWVLASAVFSLFIGFFLGRASGARQSEQQVVREREVAYKSLLEILESVGELTSDVDHRSSEIREVHRTVDGLAVSGELDSLRHVLLGQIVTVLKSNQRLEEDLNFARSRMEEQAAEIDRTRQESRTDPLTGAFNRKAFDEKLDLMVQTFHRKAIPFTLAMLDIDHFKWINDTHGHQTGDHVLTQLAQTMSGALRTHDFVARFGGDEFAILLGRSDMKTALIVAERLHQSVARINFGMSEKTGETAVTISMGLAGVREGDTCESILGRADKALYKSKRQGRNQVQVLLDTEEPSAPSSPTKDTKERRVAVQA
jgi:diguanylate cyclase